MSNDFIWPIHIGEASNEGSLISYHLMRDGIYCKKNVFADKYVFYKDENINDLPSGKENLHPIKDCKIPAILLRKTIEFFKYIFKHFNAWKEAYVIYAVDKSGKYFMFVPEQDVQQAHVHASIEEFHNLFPGCYIIADAHSHCNFGAFWSGTDNADDCKGRYSVVIGHNEKIIPEIKCRFQYSNKFVDMTIDDIFEENDNYCEQEYDFTQWITKLKDVTTTITSSSIIEDKRSKFISKYQQSFDMIDYNDLYGNYYEGFRTNQFYQSGVGKCTKCGKFKRLDDLIDIEEETLCEYCLEKLEFNLGLGE
jgi:hypothetical protein